MIQQYMQFRQYYAAYEECSKIVNADKADNEIYLLRAQCALNLGYTNDTIHDASKVITYSVKKDEINAALNLRYNAHIQAGDPKNAEIDAKKLNDKIKKESVSQLYNLIKKLDNTIKRNRDKEIAFVLDEILRISPRYIRGIFLRTDIAWRNGEMDKYQEYIRFIAEKYPDDGELQYKYGISMFCNGNTKDGREFIQKMRRKHGAPANISKVFTSLSTITRELDSASKSVEEKNITNFASSLERLNRTIAKICPQSSYLHNIVRVMDVTLLRIDGLKKKAIDLINTIISEFPGFAPAYIERGYLSLDFDDAVAAITDFRQALSIEPGNKEAIKGMKQAEEWKQKTDRLDLYKLLGVQKTATDEEIKASYKKLVKKWHPDQFSDKQKKEEAEKMMAAINAAYEVLINPQQRAKIDGSDDEPGVDPFDLFANNMGGNPFEFLRQFNFMF